MKALIVVDPQNDFMPNGSLAVTNGDSIVSVINKLTTSGKYDLVIFTKDWHPQNHKSFATQHPDKDVFTVVDLNGIPQILWPNHCVENTQGAEFHKDINMDIKNLYIFKKGMNTEVDSYSGFYENDHETSTGLTEFLSEKDVEIVHVMGLALDFCVKYTAIDASNEGFNTAVIGDGCCAIGETVADIYAELLNNDISILHSDMV